MELPDCTCKKGYVLDPESNECKKCHVSCKECMEPARNDACIDCDGEEFRVKKGDTCVCFDGY